MLHTDIDQKYQNLRHLGPGMGLNLGSSVFSRNQSNCGLSGPGCQVCVLTCIYRGLSVKKNKRKNAALRVNAFVLRLFCVCGRQKPEDSQYRRSGISGVYL